MEQQRGEPVDPRLERDLPIAVPEKLRIAQARRHDALGVAGDGALVVGLGIDDGEKRVLQLAVFRFDRKVVLMMNQRGRQDFFGKIEELVSERAGHDRRVLHQVGDFVEQPRLSMNDAADPALQPLCLGVELAGDLVVTLFPLEDHEIFEKPRAIFVKRTHLDGPPGAAAGREEAVAVGHGAGAHVLHLRSSGPPCFVRCGTGRRGRRR